MIKSWVQNMLCSDIDVCQTYSTSVIFSCHSHLANFPGEEPARAAAKGETVSVINTNIISYFAVVQVRNFLPPQSDEPEIFILEQEDYTGNYGAKNGKKRELSSLS